VEAVQAASRSALQKFFEVRGSFMDHSGTFHVFIILDASGDNCGNKVPGMGVDWGRAWKSIIRIPNVQAHFLAQIQPEHTQPLQGPFVILSIFQNLLDQQFCH
jgi:hypothetical protein